MGIASFKQRCERQRLSKRSSLKYNENENINDLWLASTVRNTNINPDSLLINHSAKVAKKLLINSQIQSAESHLFALGCQGAITKIVSEIVPSNFITDWSTTVNNLPGFLFNFVRKAMQQQLPTLSNLVRWGKTVSDQCPLCCSHSQTNKHILSNCANPLALERYSSRHDRILELIANWFRFKVHNNIDIFADLRNSKFKQCSDLFSGLRPDLAFVKGDTVHVLELTVCHETNLVSSRNYKLDKYKSLANHKSNLIEQHRIIVSTCELSVLGFLSIDPAVLLFLNIDKFDSVFRDALTRSAIQSSFDIYLSRNC